MAQWRVKYKQTPFPSPSPFALFITLQCFRIQNNKGTLPKGEEKEKNLKQGKRREKMKCIECSASN